MDVAKQETLGDLVTQVTDGDWLEDAVDGVREVTDDIREWLDKLYVNEPKVGEVPAGLRLSQRLEVAVQYLETVQNRLYPADAAREG